MGFTLHKKTAEEGRTKRNLLKILNFGNLTVEIKVQIRYESPIEDSWSHRTQMCTGCTFKDFGHNSNQTGKCFNIPANYSRPISSWMEWFGLESLALLFYFLPQNGMEKIFWNGFHSTTLNI